MNLPDKAQTDAVMRHVYTVGGTTFTIFAALALIPQDQVQPALDALHQVGDGLTTVFGGLSKLWIILGPVAIGLAAKGAGVAATFSHQVRAMIAKAGSDSPQADQAKVALVEAVSNMATGSRSAQAAQAKEALVNAAAALPEVEKVVAPTLAANPATAQNVTAQ